MSRPFEMSSPKSVGRWIGLLLLAQILLAGPVYTAPGMMRAVTGRDFLASAAADAMQIRFAVLLLFVLGSLTLAKTSTLLGNQFAYWMVMPAALTAIALALWLIAKGFEDQHCGL